MESPIDKILERYWKGETSLDEEKKIKEHFRSSPGLSKESGYFRTLKRQQRVAFETKKRGNTGKWLPVAAIITIGILTALFILEESDNDPFAIENPEHALEVTKKALMMIGSEINEGQSYTMNLIKINKAKDELSMTGDQ